ncbi:hypothetical protein [Aestuariivivens sediminis]|uniref:hypothetical protein n=1 Tax=Aestuariivivens sediminis TaxID=2913557 RepID=UPI001F5855A0|nr:hypothetical protein [Aestuariivivens sediminis]
MPFKYHPLVQKTKVELERLDKQKKISWEEWQKFGSQFLPIHTEPKLRKRALKFMDALIRKLEENNHSIKFEYQDCHIEMYGVLTQINLRQKYFRKRIPDSRGYVSNSYEKSNLLEFQAGSAYFKNWIDKKTKTLEDYLQAIYDYIEKDSKHTAECWERNRIRQEQEEAQRKIEEEKARLEAIENEKFNKLIIDAENHNTANIIRSYLKTYSDKLTRSNNFTSNTEEYLFWANKKADELDPLNGI